MVGMRKISIEEFKNLQRKVGFKISKVKGTDIIRIRKKDNPTLEDISWAEFERILKKRKLAVYKSDKNFFKIMRSR
jgi:hypothetical protein